jgi:hypothetical protein
LVENVGTLALGRDRQELGDEVLVTSAGVDLDDGRENRVDGDIGLFGLGCGVLSAMLFGHLVVMLGSMMP